MQNAKQCRLVNRKMTRNGAMNAKLKHAKKKIIYYFFTWRAYVIPELVEGNLLPEWKLISVFRRKSFASFAPLREKYIRKYF
jgi:hypothetical protein